MAGLWADNPDYYTTSELLTVWTTNISASGATLAFTANEGRRGSGNACFTFTPAAGAAAHNYITKTLNPGDNTICISFGLKYTAANGANLCTNFSIGDSDIWHIGMIRNSDGTLGFYRGRNLNAETGGTLIGNGATALSIGTYYSIQIKCTIHDTTGVLSCKINGIEDLNSGSGYTDIDTQNAGTATWRRIGFGVRTSATGTQGATTRICDIVVNDGTGDYNNTYPGDCAVLVDVPSTGNGGNTDFTPSTGTDHGALVDDATPNDDTDYNVSSALNQRDTYVFPDLALSTGTPKFVINRMRVKLSESGEAGIVGVTRRNSTNSDGSVTMGPSSASYNYFDDIRELDPETSAEWTIANLNDTELGVKRSV
jgi:hypothetical protein